MNQQNIHNILREAAAGYKSSSEVTIVELARQGISKKSLLKLVEISSISLKQFSELLPVSLRTIHRYNDEVLLPHEVSEHALLIAEVLGRGLDVFNDKEKLQQWLQTSSVALNGSTPAVRIFL